MRLYCGKQLEIRIAGMSEYVRTRMWRAGFEVVDEEAVIRGDVEASGAPMHFASLARALTAPRGSAEGSLKERFDEKKGDAVERVEDVEEKV